MGMILSQALYVSRMHVAIGPGTRAIVQVQMMDWAGAIPSSEGSKHLIHASTTEAILQVLTLMDVFFLHRKDVLHQHAP